MIYPVQSWFRNTLINLANTTNSSLATFCDCKPTCMLNIISEIVTIKAFLKVLCSTQYVKCYMYMIITHLVKYLDFWQIKWQTFEPAHEIMALFVLRKLILQTRTRSHPVGLDVWFWVVPFVYFYTSCVRTAKALARLRECAGSPEPSLVAYVINPIMSWAGSFHFKMHKNASA